MVTGVVRRAQWLPRVALVSGALGLIGLAAINPDAWVANRNIDRYEATGDLDLRYLQDLSADAVPVIAERLPSDVARCVLQYMPWNEMRAETLDDPRAWNLGRSRAEGPLGDLGLLPVQEQVAYSAGPAAVDDECAGVWAAFGG